jgi:hypothetical protein
MHSYESTSFHKHSPYHHHHGSTSFDFAQDESLTINQSYGDFAVSGGETDGVSGSSLQLQPHLSQLTDLQSYNHLSHKRAPYLFHHQSYSFFGVLWKELSTVI